MSASMTSTVRARKHRRGLYVHVGDLIAHLEAADTTTDALVEGLREMQREAQSSGHG